MKLRKVLRISLAILFGIAGLLMLCTSLAEHVFFEKIIAVGSEDILHKGYTAATMQFALPLVANGTIQFLSFPVKAGLAVVGIFLSYISALSFLYINRPEFKFRSIFSRDYWLKFSLVRYKKTQVSKI